MEKKQRLLSNTNYSRIIFILAICLHPFVAFSQLESLLKTDYIKTTIYFDSKDSTLTIDHIFNGSFPVLVWVGDFNLGAISSGDVSPSYLASSVSHEIYLIKRGTILNKTTNKPVSRKDREIFGLNDYKYLSTGDTLEIVTKILDKKIYKDIVGQQCFLLGRFSFISGFDLNIDQAQDFIQKASTPELNKWTETNTFSKPSKFTVELDKKQWKYDLPKKFVYPDGIPFQVNGGEFAIEDLTKPKGLINSDLKFKSLLDVLSHTESYKFQNKIILKRK